MQLIEKYCSGATDFKFPAVKESLLLASLTFGKVCWLRGIGLDDISRSLPLPNVLGSCDVLCITFNGIEEAEPNGIVL